MFIQNVTEAPAWGHDFFALVGPTSMGPLFWVTVWAVVFPGKSGYKRQEIYWMVMCGRVQVGARNLLSFEALSLLENSPERRFVKIGRKTFGKAEA